MKNILFILLLLPLVCFSQLTQKVPLYVLLPSYTQAQEDSIKVTYPANATSQQIYNRDSLKVRIWNGTVFVSVPPLPAKQLPLATTLLQGAVPATGTPTGKYLKDDLTWGTIAAGGDMLKSDNLSNLSNYVTARTNLGLGTLATQSGTVSGVNTGDNAINTLYSGLISNATHTGDAIGATALTVVKINGVLMSGLATGILKNTTITGAPSIAVAGDFPTLNQNTTGTAGGLSANIAESQVTNLVSDLALKSPLASPTFTGTVTLPAGTVSLANMANMATASLIYRKTAGTGVPEVNTLAQLKTDLVLVKGDVGLSSVDNTSDVSKPVSTAQQTALNLKADLASPTFTGTVTLPGSTSLTTPILGTPTSGTLTNCTFPTLNQSTTGSAATLTTPRNINGVAFNGSANIAVTADASTLSGTVLNSTVVTSSLTSLGTVTTGAITVAGAITSSGAGIGYATGAGGTVTQATSRTTTAVLNKLCGTITMFSAAQLNNALVTFTFTNSFIAATDYLLIQHISATNGGAWCISTVCSAGSATINIRNVTAASITEATPLKFLIIKGVTN